MGRFAIWPEEALLRKVFEQEGITELVPDNQGNFIGSSAMSKIKLHHKTNIPAGEAILVKDFIFEANKFKLTIGNKAYQGRLDMVSANVKSPLSMIYIYALFYPFIQVKMYSQEDGSYLELSDVYESEEPRMKSLIRIPCEFLKEASDTGTIVYEGEDHFVIVSVKGKFNPLHLYIKGYTLTFSEQRLQEIHLTKIRVEEP